MSNPPLNVRIDWAYLLADICIRYDQEVAVLLPSRASLIRFLHDPQYAVDVLKATNRQILWACVCHDIWNYLKIPFSTLNKWRVGGHNQTELDSFESLYCYDQKPIKRGGKIYEKDCIDPSWIVSNIQQCKSFSDVAWILDRKRKDIDRISESIPRVQLCGVPSGMQQQGTVGVPEPIGALYREKLGKKLPTRMGSFEQCIGFIKQTFRQIDYHADPVDRPVVKENRGKIVPTDIAMRDVNTYWERAPFKLGFVTENTAFAKTFDKIGKKPFIMLAHALSVSRRAQAIIYLPVSNIWFSDIHFSTFIFFLNYTPTDAEKKCLLQRGFLYKKE